VFDIGFSELLLIGVVALLVLGPERLPRAARIAGLWMRRARASWYSLRSEFERELADEDLRRSIRQGAEAAKSLQQDMGDTARALRTELDSVAASASAPVPDSANPAGGAIASRTRDASTTDATDAPPKDASERAP
jgi:sec-independent protein translocase protein TatB